MEFPKLLSKVWANLGLKNNIPESRTSGLSDELATYDDGFPSITMTPIAQGGKAPAGKDMNGVLHEITAHIVHQNKGGNYVFNAEFATKIGGYEKGAVLISDDFNKFFVSLVNQNKVNFNNADYSKHWAIIATTDLVNYIKPKTLSETSKNAVDATGHSHELSSASLLKKGIVKLFSGTDSNSEELAATPKAIKTLKDLINANIRNFGNYIPNSKKSNAVNSSSTDTVATSLAAKTAYDLANTASEKADWRIIRDGNPHRIALSWRADGLNAQVDNSGLGVFVFENSSPNFSEVSLSSGKKLSKTHQTTDAYVETTTNNYFGGLRINRPNSNDVMMIESGGHNAFDFIRRATNGDNIYVISTQAKSGVFALLSDVEERVNKKGDTVGKLRIGNASNWDKVEFPTTGTGCFLLETHPNAALGSPNNIRMNWSFREGATTKYLTFPEWGTKNETVAYQSWVNDKTASLQNAVDERIIRDGSVHRIALSWSGEELKAQVDATDLGGIVFQSRFNEKVSTLLEQINTKLAASNLDAGQQYIRAFGTYIVGGGGTAGGNGTSISNLFPIAFPTACVAVIPVHIGTDQSANIIVEHNSISRTGFSAKSSHRLNSAIHYIAIGY